MSDPRLPPEPPSRPNGFPWLWIALIGGVALLIVALAKLFPGAVQGRDWTSVAYSAGVLLLLCAGFSRIDRAKLPQHLRHLAIWLLIGTALLLAYAYRDVFADTRQRLGLALSGGRPVAGGERELIVPRDESVHFLIIGRVNGQPVRFLVDTGATDTVLSPADARRLGFDVESLDYGYESETANGVGYAAAQTVDRLEVGPIRADNFRVMVNKAPMSASLLGMSFLGGLESYAVRGDRLTLTWRGG